MANWFNHINDWSEFRRFLILFGVAASAAIVIATKYANWRIEENTEEVGIDEKLSSLQKGQDSLSAKYVRFEQENKEFRNQEENKVQELTQSVKRVDRNLKYYIRHQGDMTTQQILEAFELGREAGVEEQKKTTVSKPLSNIDGGKNTSITENQTSSLYP